MLKALFNGAETLTPALAAAAKISPEAAEWLMKGIAKYGDTVTDLLHGAAKNADVAAEWGLLVSAVRKAEDSGGILKSADELIEGAGEVSKSWGSTDNLINSATTPGKGGVSPVGRAFQKHAGNPNRAGTFVGDVSGNAAKNTEQGARYVSEILNNPKSIYKTSHSNVFGDILDVRLPDGTGARWSADGKRFIMFLEKYTH
ncbi:hypothetical protein SAMN02745168_2605 [Papillibacter cinnamivorans DSM 12816]|uniref:Uncharacterized protein n=1 Tax=Papillibacter cinnamivorans DSM 12816 TaxID=1122930 RepID=A0A1W2C903_9FIRM|nr:hypothetical protein SAMN02745168_2605 [Papillibacter cinnamivorans DSM 12816]